VFTFEIPAGTWGGFGQVFRLPDIAAFAAGEPARQHAEQRLAERRRQNAVAILEAARPSSGANPPTNV
jgi:hypothetical protein